MILAFANNTTPDMVPDHRSFPADSGHGSTAVVHPPERKGQQHFHSSTRELVGMVSGTTSTARGIYQALDFASPVEILWTSENLSGSSGPRINAEETTRVGSLASHKRRHILGKFAKAVNPETKTDQVARGRLRFLRENHSGYGL